MFFDDSRLKALETAVGQLRDELRETRSHCGRALDEIRRVRSEFRDVEDELTRRTEKLLKRAQREAVAPPEPEEAQAEPPKALSARRSIIERQLAARRNGV